MPSYRVRIQGPNGSRRTIHVDAADAEQARRRGKDGGNRVVWIDEPESEDSPADEQGTIWQTVETNDD